MITILLSITEYCQFIMNAQSIIYKNVCTYNYFKKINFLKYFFCFLKRK